jgi:hypothetical protein
MSRVSMKLSHQQMLPSIILTHIFTGLIVFILKCGLYGYGVGAQYMRNDRPFFK